MQQRAKQDSAPSADLQTARAAQRSGDHRVAVRNYESFLARNKRDHREFSAALYEAALSYEALGDTARAGQLYRLVRSSGGRYAGMAAKRLARMNALTTKRKKSKRKPKAKVGVEEERAAEPAAAPDNAADQPALKE